MKKWMDDRNGKNGAAKWCGQLKKRKQTMVSASVLDQTGFSSGQAGDLSSAVIGTTAGSALRRSGAGSACVGRGGLMRSFRHPNGPPGFGWRRIVNRKPEVSVVSRRLRRVSDMEDTL